MPYSIRIVSLPYSVSEYSTLGGAPSYVFANLIENSIKHAHGDGPPVIDIIQSRVCNDGIEYHMITLEDNGSGIPDELKAKIFDRYPRGKRGLAARVRAYTS